MAILPLTKLWINRLDTGEAVSGATGRGRSQSFAMDLSVRTYASGRRRAISTAGEAGEVPFTLVQCTLDQVTTLRSWKGISVQVRDHRAQKWFGVFGEINVSEYMRPDLYSLTFTLRLVTFTEGV